MTTLLDALSFLESDLDVIARAVVAVGLKVTKPRKRRKANPCVLNHYPPVQPVWKHDIKVVSVDDETGTTNVRACVGHLQNPYEDEVVA
ncbi:MAG: hypothetical protein LBI33_12755 [Propionibacteriaceae bacterium]|nr:hypothetical protein [Propionibacteriaceae bacterium]